MVRSTEDFCWYPCTVMARSCKMCFQLCNYMPLTMVIHMVAGSNFHFVLFVFGEVWHFGILVFKETWYYSYL